MKKIFIKTLTCIVASVSSIALSACGSGLNSGINNSESEHTHIWSTTWSYDETEHWQTCSGCNDVHNVQPHSFDENNECVICHYIDSTPSVPVHSHNLMHINEVPANCMEEGNIEYWYCTECQKYYLDESCQTEIDVEDTVIATTSHMFTDWKILVEPTCEHDGEREGYCIYCKKTTTEILPKYDHSYVWSHTLSEHWQVCENGCNYQSAKENHTWNTDNQCEVCNYNLPYSNGLEYRERTDIEGNVIDYYVSKGSCTDSNVILPAYHNNLPVVGLNGAAFEDDNNLESIILTSNIQIIGYNAFYNCTSLKEVTIEENVSTIASNAFSNCTSLTTVNWFAEDCIATSNIFSGCENLTSFIVGNNVKYFPNIINDNSTFEYTEKDGALYLGNEDNPFVLLYKPTSKDIKSIDLEGTHIIYDEAFRDCTMLETVTGTEDLSSIGSYAFYGCSALSSIVLSENIAEIEQYTFYDCDSLSEITLGSGLESVGRNAFSYCDELDTVYYTGTLLDWCEIQFTIPASNGCFQTEWDLYINDKLAEDIEIPNGVTTIKTTAFFLCKSLKSVIIPDSVTDIQDWAFGRCNNLSDVSLGNGVTDISNNAFPRSGALQYTLYSNAYYLGNAANPYIALIYGEETATTCNVNNSTRIICDYAFDENKNLKEVTIGRDVVYIGSYAFYLYGNLTKATFVDPEGWTRLNGDTHEIESVSSSSLSNSSTAAKLLIEVVEEIRNPGSVSETTYIYPYVWYKQTTL